MPEKLLVPEAEGGAKGEGRLVKKGLTGGAGKWHWSEGIYEARAHT